MATTTIPWGDGSGDNIYLTYSSASGNQTVGVTSDANTGDARSKVITFTSGVGNITQSLTVNQESGLSGIPYIRNTSLGAYIDTGITADNTVKVIVWARNFNSNGGFLFGARTALADSMFEIGCHDGTSSGRIRLDYGTTYSTHANDQFKNLSHYRKYEYYQGVLRVDDVTVATASSATFSSNYSIHLFGTNNGGAHMDTSFPIDICKAQIYKGGVLVRDFRATSSHSNGLFDAVSNTLFTNAGAGSFTYGVFDPDAYTPIEYVECNGNQYFDSGVTIGYSDSIIGKFRVYNTYVDDAIFGYRDGSKWCEVTVANSGSNIRVYYRFGSDSTWYQLYSGKPSNVVGSDIVFAKRATAAMALYKNNAAFGNTRTPSAQSSFVTPGSALIGAEKWTTSSPVEQKKFHGRLYYELIGGKSFVPAIVNNVAGMYDTYNDVFHTSESNTDFIAGPEL